MDFNQPHPLLPVPSGSLEIRELPILSQAGDDRPLGPVPIPLAPAHAGVRAPFAFPDGTELDLVVTPSGWRRRR